MPGTIDYEALLSELGSNRFTALRPAQREMLERYAADYTGVADVAIELPTGAGKSLIAIMIGEAWRREGKSVAILTGNKTLARQTEAEAHALGIPVVRMEGAGPSIPAKDKRNYHRSGAVAVMNYWVYFNQNPVIDPADLLVMDDAHLAEHCLHSLYSVEINAFDHKALFELLVQELSARFPDYAVLQDALDENVPPRANVELLSFLDQDTVASRIREIVDASPNLESGADLRFRWRRIRGRLDEVNVYLADRSLWFRPYIYPLLANDYYARPAQRIYMSATIGDPEDLARRLGSAKSERIGISSEHASVTYGRRMLVMNKIEDIDIPNRLASVILAALKVHPKSVWLCPSRAKAQRFRSVVSEWLNGHGIVGHPTWLLTSLGDEIDQFKSAPQGHLFVAGRFDGMDFNADECRLVVVATLPKSINTQEEFLTAHLQDPGFMLKRLNQRVVQALGRCNRSEDDYGIYVLADRRFATHFGRDSNRQGLPRNMMAEIDSAEDATELEEGQLVDRVVKFLNGDFAEFDADLTSHRQDLAVPELAESGDGLAAQPEVDGWVNLFHRQDYPTAQDNFAASVAGASAQPLRPVAAFLLWCEGKAAFLRGKQGDAAARAEALDLLDDAIGCGSHSSWFNRLRSSVHRHRASMGASDALVLKEYPECVVHAFDELLEKLGTKGTRFAKWRDRIAGQLNADSRTQFQEGLENLGNVLGYTAIRPKYGAATDCRWRGVFGNIREVVTFEAKIEGVSTTQISASNVGQAHNQATRAHTQYGSVGFQVRGTLVTHLSDIEDSARSSLGEIRILSTDAVGELWARISSLLSTYRDSWSLEDVEARLIAAQGLIPKLPAGGWLTRALSGTEEFVSADDLFAEWP